MMNRRQFIKTTSAAGLGCCLFPITGALHAAPGRKKVLLLGIDGMDPHLTYQYMQKGVLPNLSKVAKKGSIMSVANSMPPQSPVAWSDVTVGAPSAVHGIYDFIHREARTMLPYLSTSRVTPPSRVLHMGDYRIPLSKGRTELLRQGRPFWKYLAERDIPTTIFKMPANFPCEEDGVNMVSGMGTPDLRGGYGSFTLFTTDRDRLGKDITGGKIAIVRFSGNRVDTQLPGPVNSLKEGSPKIDIPVTIWRDRVNPVVRIRIQGRELLLNQGDWSDWIQVSFPMLGAFYDVKGILKVYVKSVHPDFEMYVSPINIDPAEPVLPIVSPKDYGKKLAGDVGKFYTQGFPEDTKALSEGIFSDTEYLELAEQIIVERKRLLEHEFGHFNRLDHGMLFFYFSSLDQNSHMFWRAIDHKSPLYDPELGRKFGETLMGFYMEIDHMLGKILQQYDINDPGNALMIMSDHGFCPFRRQVNLNSWLYEKGYLALNSTRNIEDGEFFAQVNWSRTGAYNLGINSIYINQVGREMNGAVARSQAKGLLGQIRSDLLDLRDPATGEKAVSRVRVVPEEEHQRHPDAPDLIVGWNYGYRTSWKSILGGFEVETISDNLDKWSGDHCVDPFLVPAILVTNKQVTKTDPNLCDITATVLNEFNIPLGGDITGRPLYRS
ncbi:MAG: hypothetical protein GY864_09375 [Desulfobacterales bacterium]|nr:hypothetical protein [Desulfobacterales bacterium]